MSIKSKDCDRINMEKAQAEWDAAHPEPTITVKLYEALKRAVKEENRNWEVMCRVNKEFEMRTPERLAWVIQAEEAILAYEKQPNLNK